MKNNYLYKKEILESLIKFDLPYEKILPLIKQIWWNDFVIVTLAIKDVINVLDKFINWKIDPKDISNWANLIEWRDDIAYENNKIVDIISELSNPEINFYLTKTRAKEIIDILNDRLVW